MRKRERERLRNAIARAVADYARKPAEMVQFRHSDFGPVETRWYRDRAAAWRNEDVVNEVRAVYERVCKALGVKARKG